ncbi:MAG TPA: hypothetical protein ENO08_03495, partial [Candidatus Eisenbacteria bacterium]|nr:hypothetical protein [Candidatus Eisenbacteria bacterium]
MPTREPRSVRIRSGWKIWIAVIAIAVILHLAFFSFFKLHYLRVFQSELPGDEGESRYPDLDAPFSYVQLYEQPEARPIAERAPAIE